jgi:hypothetical protein
VPEQSHNLTVGQLFCIPGGRLWHFASFAAMQYFWSLLG